MTQISQMNTDGLYAELTQTLIGCAFDVHRELGAGFLESVYRNALELALIDQRLRVRREVEFDVHFRGRRVGTFRADLIVEETVIVQTKAAEALTEAHEAQLINDLNATGLEVGLLINFSNRVQVKRKILSTHLRPSVQSV